MGRSGGWVALEKIMSDEEYKEYLRRLAFVHEYGDVPEAFEYKKFDELWELHIQQNRGGS